MTERPGVLIVDELGGADDVECPSRLAVMVRRAGIRLGTPDRVLEAFLPPGEPSLLKQAGRLAVQGVTHLVILPALPRFSPSFRARAEAAAAAIRQHLPGLTVATDLPESADRRLENLWVDQIWPLWAGERVQPAGGAAIEGESRRLIERTMEQAGVRFAPDEYAVARRVVHAAADVSFLDSIRFSPGAVARGVAALRAGKPLVCDVRMLAAGCTHGGGELLCAIHEPAVIEAARRHGITRAAAAMRQLGDRLHGAIVAIGNAPTALWTVMEMAAGGGPVPALVIGMPVGFVGALEAKTTLAASALPHITNLSPRGGSPAAAAVVNALADLARPRTGGEAA